MESNSTKLTAVRYPTNTDTDKTAIYIPISHNASQFQLVNELCAKFCIVNARIDLFIVYQDGKEEKMDDFGI